MFCTANFLCHVLKVSNLIKIGLNLSDFCKKIFERWGPLPHTHEAPPNQQISCHESNAEHPMRLALIDVEPHMISKIVEAKWQ